MLTIPHLQDPLKRLGQIIDKKSTLPILECVLIEPVDGGVTLVATDLEVTLSTTIVAEGSTKPAAVSLPCFRSVLENYEGPVSLDIGWLDGVYDDGRITIEAGGTFTAPIKDAHDFPAVPEPEEPLAEVAVSNLAEALTQVVPYVSHNALRPAMMGAHLDFESALVVATDGHRLIKTPTAFAARQKANSVIIPRKAAVQIAALCEGCDDTDSTVRILQSLHHASFLIGSYQLTTRLIKEPYPNYGAVIPADGTSTMTADRASLLKLVNRASRFASPMTNQIVMELSGGSGTITAADIERAREAVLPIVCQTDAELRIRFNATYLSEILANMNSDQVTMRFQDSPHKAVLIDDGTETTRLLMPVLLDTYMTV